MNFKLFWGMGSGEALSYTKMAREPNTQKKFKNSFVRKPNT